MFRATRSLSAFVKSSTGIVGLEVRPNGRQELIELYRKTLDHVATRLPSDVFYRQSVEKFTKFRLAQCEKYEDIRDIEAAIRGGQIEELIVQAEDEMKLIDKYAEWRLWENPPPPTTQPILPDNGLKLPGESS